MRNWMTIAVASLLMLSCSSNTNSTDIKPTAIPAAVQGAFDTEHPYAQMNHPKSLTATDGSVTYLIPYTRPDGTSGKVTYAPTGEILSGQ